MPGLLIAGCGGPGPLAIKKNAKLVGPWCGPNQRVQIGERVVGHVHDGPKYKIFLVDDRGREHDPEKIAENVWSYLERTGDAKKIQGRFANDAYQTSMNVVSINPIVVVLGTYQDPSWRKQNREVAYKRWYWPAQVSSLGEPTRREEMRWCSPDLKRSPVALTFSKQGLAEIPLPNGKLTLTRLGDRYKTVRE